MHIKFENVCFKYESLVTNPHVALEALSFDIEPGELVAIVGATGSGKTTLIQHFNGLLLPSSGRIRIGTFNITDQRSDFHAIRSKVGLVFQFPEIQLFEETVYEDIAFGPKNFRWSQSKIDQSVKRALELVGLEASRFGPLHPFQLSGGEKRRVAIAGVLAMDPSILVLDEPTAGLDWRGTQKIESIVKQYYALKRTVIFVSHDMDLVARLAHRVLVLKQGKLVFDGSKSNLFNNGALLHEAGLRLPYITQAIHALEKEGLHMRSDIFSIQEARSEINRLYHSSSIK